VNTTASLAARAAPFFCPQSKEPDMTTRTPDDARESTSFKIAAQKIDNLLKRLNEKRVCPCCTSRALTLHAACMAENVLGSAKAIEMFEDIIMTMHENDVPAPDYGPSTEAH
jgi:hypothetical protein